MIDPRQLRAALELLNWTTADLADATGLALDTVRKICRGSHRPQKDTERKLVDALERRGVKLLPGCGVQLEDMMKVLEGEEAYLRMLADVYDATHKHGGEVLWLYSNDRCTLPGEYAAEVRLREAGVRFRSLIEEGHTETTWPATEYRQIPRPYFTHTLHVIYADRVAQVFQTAQRVLILRDETFATTARHTFNLLWSLMSPLPKKPGKPHGA